MVTVIRNARVLTLDAHGTEHLEADIMIDGEAIKAVGPEIGATATTADTRIIEGKGLLAMPGLVNGHFHSPGNFMKGALPNTPLELFMLYEVPPLMDRVATPRFAYVRTMLGAMEMLKQGVTAVHDDCFFVPVVTHEEVDSVMRAYADFRHARDRDARPAKHRRAFEISLPKGHSAGASGGANGLGAADGRRRALGSL